MDTGEIGGEGGGTIQKHYSIMKISKKIKSNPFILIVII